MSEHQVKPGDKLAIDIGKYERDYVIKTVEKITPKGMIRLHGGTLLNPDLSVRGMYATYAEPVTQEIMEKIEMKILRSVLWRLDCKALGLTLDEMRAIRAIIDTAKARKSQ